MDLTEIKVTGYDPYDPVEEEGGAFGEVLVQELNENGRNTSMYQFFDYEEEGTKYYGWYKDGDPEQPIAKGDVVLAPGEGILTKSDDAGYGFQSAGQVLTDKDQPVLLRKLAKMVANITPVVVDLKDCYVTGYDPYDPVEEEGGAFGEVLIQELNENGRNTSMYQFFDYEEEGTKYFGWYKDGDPEQPIKAGDVMIGPGLGILTKSEDAGYSFVWPKVDVK